MPTASDWFKQGLVSRIDTLEAALASLESGDTESATAIVQCAESLRDPAASYELPRISRAAEQVGAADPDSLAEAARKLISLLREEASRIAAPLPIVLLVGGQPEFNTELAAALATPNREIQTADGARPAENAIKSGRVAVLILNAFLADADARAFLMQLREDPNTAALPVLVLGPKSAESPTDAALTQKADGYMEPPFDTAAVCEWVNARLRRSHETDKLARRDSLTGLPNRADFSEAFSALMWAYQTSRPLALVLIAANEREPDGSGALTGPVGDETVRSVAALLSTSFRNTDVLARWEHGEFVALCPGEDQFGGKRAVDKVIRRAASEGLGTAAGQREVFLSAGVVLVQEGSTLHEAVAAADRQLLQARTRGGNCAATQAAEAPTGSQHILLLIPDDVTGRILTQLFEADGFKVTRAENSDDAGCADTEGGIQLVMIDEKLRNEDGLDVLHTLKGLPQFEHTPFVMLLAEKSEQSSGDRALELGAAECVSRPFSPFSLMTRMRRLLAIGSAPLSSESSQLRVLIIDDESAPLLIAATALKQRGGFDIRLARGGQDGCHRFRELKPSVVIVDMNMPDISGLQVVNAVFELSDPEHTAVIMAAENVDDVEIEKLTEKGAKGAIKKPYAPLSFASHVDRLLGNDPEEPRPASQQDDLNAEMRRILNMDV